MKTEKRFTTRKCEDLGGKCTICGLSFPEGDEFCGNGHEIGKYYSVPKTSVPPKKEKILFSKN